ALAEMIEQIDIHTNSGLAIEDCLNKVYLKLTISDDFFLEIAKHRALRRLFSSVASSYGVENPRLEIVSQAGPWTSEIDDPHSFMLHATTQAMSAILGGTDALLVEPFYNIFPNKPALAERIARNISTILSEESYLNKMVDPAAGSYYIEQLTQNLYNNALDLLKKIEAAGGISKIDVESFNPEAL
ncbi:MAG: methylmalonyl-CoA mutase, partial [Cytophagia bacterium]|nr:methylmalonyl-CoA mutase [Cytophagia bacterium]